MAPSSRTLRVAFLSWISAAWALQVTPGSPCATLCLDDKNGNPLDAAASTTGISNIVCDDADYSSSALGVKFRSCMECLQTSTAVNGAESDQAWYLYNLRYAVDVCVFSFPNTTSGISSPCALDQTCGPMKDALVAGNLDPQKTTDFEYCSLNNGVFTTQGSSCSQCLALSSGRKYLSNFVVALSAACQQRPSPGTLLSLSGSVFSTTAVTFVTPANQTAAGTQSSGLVMTTGAIVGIAVGTSLLLLGGLALLFVYCRRQRRHAEKDPTLLPPMPKTPASCITITSRTIPYYTTDYKSQCPDVEPKDPPDYQSNAEYYDRMAEVMQSRHPSEASLALPPKDLAALPTHPAYIPRVTGRASRVTSPNLDVQAAARPNKPDSYALQQYLTAAEDSLNNNLPPPPPNPPTSSRSIPRSQLSPPAVSIRSHLGSPPAGSIRSGMGSPPAGSIRQPMYSPPAASLRQPMYSPPALSLRQPMNSPPAASIRSNPASPPAGFGSHLPSPPPPSVRSYVVSPPPSSIMSINTPPPPPPPGSRAPSLSLPMPRVKVPRKYVPPKIQIQGATPIEGPSAMDISLPIAYHEERFRDAREHREPRVSPGLSTGGLSDDSVVEQMISLPRRYKEVPIVSGKSILYG